MKNHPIPDEAMKSPVAIVGTVGSGKTFTAKGKVEPILQTGARVCIIDPTGAWFGLKYSADGQGPGFPVVIFGGEHADVPIDDTMGEAIGHLIATTNMQCVLDLSLMTMGGRVRFVCAFLESVYHHNKHTLYLVLDEADLFAPQRPLPDQNVMLNRCEQIVRRGRIKGFRVMMITQRPAELHKSVLSQAGTLVAMKLTAPQDRNAIGAWIEGQGDAKKGKALLEDLPRLKVGEGYVWCPALDILSKTKFPRISTFDSSKTPEPGDETSQPMNAAPVDLSAVRDQLAAKVKELDESDVEKLKARVRELQAKLAAGGEQRSLNQAEADTIRRTAFRESYALAYENAVTDLESIMAGLRENVDPVLARWKAKAAEGDRPVAVPAPAESARGSRAYGVTHQREQFQAQDTRHNAGDGIPPPAATSVPPAPDTASKVVSGSVETGLSRGERAVLTVLAQFNPMPVSYRRAAAISGYSARSSTWRGILAGLRKPEFIGGGPDGLTITAAGLNALGSFDRLPTGRALLDHWCTVVPKGQRDVLMILSALSGQGSAADVAQRAGYSPSSSTWRGVLAGLRALDLIEGSRVLKLHEDLR